MRNFIFKRISYFINCQNMIHSAQGVIRRHTLQFSLLKYFVKKILSEGWGAEKNVKHNKKQLKNRKKWLAFKGNRRKGERSSCF